MKNVLVGVTGGIAAYKAVEVCRRLSDKGCDVRVVMTHAATEFVTPLTFQAITGHPVHRDTFDEAAEAAMGHIEIAKWADQIIVAPASADFMARLSAGMANDLLSTICLATAAPIAICPAMNQQMWRAPATQSNLVVLKQRKVMVLGPDEGEQACGDVGPGRLLDPSRIVNELTQKSGDQLRGQKWLITAGPTREAIDPVRFLSNHSSGKMGYAIAQAARRMGADVQLVSGPVGLTVPEGVERRCVKTAEEMLQQVMSEVGNADVFVACAAVADYRPVSVPKQKMKKTADTMSIELTKNPDILQLVGQLPNKPVCVGFAAETENVEEYALGKLERKNLEMICANNVSRSGIGFDADENELMIIFKGGESKVLPQSCKHDIASALVSEISQRFVTVKMS